MRSNQSISVTISSFAPEGRPVEEQNSCTIHEYANGCVHYSARRHGSSKWDYYVLPMSEALMISGVEGEEKGATIVRKTPGVEYHTIPNVTDVVDNEDGITSTITDEEGIEYIVSNVGVLMKGPLSEEVVKKKSRTKSRKKQ